MEKINGNNLVTIIMPVYNGEKYIEKSIHSVYQQGYSSIELIIVNDGSQDRSSLVLNKMFRIAPDHVSVKILDQTNHGICYSRNRALENACGKYVMFMDQDDYMREDCVEKLYIEMEEKNADMVIGGFDFVDCQGKVLEEWTLEPDCPWSKFRITAPWGRMFRKELIDKYNIRFMITKISEDLYFNILYMSYCKMIHVTSYKGYCWLFNEKSESHSKMNKLDKERNPLIMLTELHNKMNQPNILEKDCLEYMMTKHIIWYLFFVAKGADSNAMKLAYQECFKWLDDFYPAYMGHMIGHFSFPKGENVKTKFIVKMALVLKQCRLLLLVLKAYARILG